MVDQADPSGGGVLDEVEAALRALGSVDPLDVTDEQREQAVVGFMRLRSLVESVAAPWTRSWERSRSWAADGSRSPRARLARDAHCSEASAGRAVGLAAKLEAMPLVAAALRAGSISEDHAWRLAVARTGHRAGAFALAEQTLVDVAVEEPDFDEFLKAVQYWEHGADDALGASEDQHRRHRAGRKAHHSKTFQGTYRLDATFDAVGGEIFDTALGRIYHQLLMADWKAARAEHGDAACESDLCRTPEQRRLDALVEMARRATAVAADAKLPRPLITVLVDYEQLKGPIRETFNGNVLTTHQVADLLVEADVERAVYGPTNRIIELSTTERFFRGGLRRVLEIRDRHCQHPGCRVPAERCNGNHVIEHTDGGQTTQENGDLQCRTHDRQRWGRRKTPPAGSDDDPDDHADEQTAHRPDDTEKHR